MSTHKIIQGSRPAGADARNDSYTFLILMTIVVIGTTVTVSPTNGQQHSPASTDRRLKLALNEPTVGVDGEDSVEIGSKELLQKQSSLEQHINDGAQMKAQVNIFVRKSYILCSHQSNEGL